MAPEYEDIGGGSYRILKKKKKESSAAAWIIGILVVLFLIGLAA